MKFPTYHTSLPSLYTGFSKKARFTHIASKVMLEMPLGVPVRINVKSPFLGDIVS